MCKEQNRSADIKNELAAKSRATGIKEQVLAEINKLAETYQIKKVVLFGSRARGDFRERSDIDLAVYGGNFTRFSLDIDEKTWILLQYDFVDMNQPVQPELIAKEELWLEALTSRNNASHAYNRNVALQIIEKTKNVYYPMFQKFRQIAEASWM